MPRDILEKIAEIGPKNEAELKSLMEELPSRYQRFGKEILEISINESSDDDESALSPDELEMEKDR